MVPRSSQAVEKADSRSTRDSIKHVARQMFISRGLTAVTFADIADRVGTTRANLHYHFGSKGALIREVFQETFAAVSQTLNEIWVKPGLTLDERIALTAQDARQRYDEFNPTGRERSPWSLSARARFENEVLGDDILAGIVTMSREFEEDVARAVKQAIRSGELRPDAPVREIVLLISPLWYFGSPITQFAGWDKLDQHYTAVRNVIRRAYGA